MANAFVTLNLLAKGFRTQEMDPAIDDGICGLVPVGFCFNQRKCIGK